MRKHLFCCGIALPGLALLALLAILALFATGCAQAPVATPTGFKQWNAKDGSFRIDYPDDWEADGGGRQGSQWATFQKGSAKIRVSVSSSESVLDGTLGSGFEGGAVTKRRVDESSGAVSEDEVIPPVAIVHDFHRDEIEKDYADYRERGWIPFSAPLGQGRKSEFKAGSGPTQVHGYRATVLNNQLGITVICHCAEQDWGKLQSAFDTILETLTRGNPTN